MSRRRLKYSSAQFTNEVWESLILRPNSSPLIPNLESLKPVGPSAFSDKAVVRMLESRVLTPESPAGFVPKLKEVKLDIWRNMSSSALWRLQMFERFGLNISIEVDPEAGETGSEASDSEIEESDDGDLEHDPEDKESDSENEESDSEDEDPGAGGRGLLSGRRRLEAGDTISGAASGGEEEGRGKKRVSVPAGVASRRKRLEPGGGDGDGDTGLPTKRRKDLNSAGRSASRSASAPAAGVLLSLVIRLRAVVRCAQRRPPAPCRGRHAAVLEVVELRGIGARMMRKIWVVVVNASEASALRGTAGRRSIEYSPQSTPICPKPCPHLARGAAHRVCLSVLHVNSHDLGGGGGRTSWKEVAGGRRSADLDIPGGYIPVGWATSPMYMLRSILAATLDAYGSATTLSERVGLLTGEV
ncbi:hypothetical protein K438DRAFT_1762612 [Mycena galopus ATCC 62051]|nr:hypothetical protein K438DRAFT_1762612 [Mycena galopus ATCC 62051]